MILLHAFSYSTRYSVDNDGSKEIPCETRDMCTQCNYIQREKWWGRRQGVTLPEFILRGAQFQYEKEMNRHQCDLLAFIPPSFIVFIRNLNGTGRIYWHLLLKETKTLWIPTKWVRVKWEHLGFRQWVLIAETPSFCIHVASLFDLYALGTCWQKWLVGYFIPAYSDPKAWSFVCCRKAVFAVTGWLRL